MPKAPSRRRAKRPPQTKSYLLRMSQPQWAGLLEKLDDLPEQVSMNHFILETLGVAEPTDRFFATDAQQSRRHQALTQPRAK
ncbi:hypothetical protein [Aureliella helgolandensis]|uniref:Uncharacterized protein n=1 Tax=Aureliella helgolandensis TaxID=2527968 RepID=A0A518GE79_9BACT|nr:hypothetical protein [Aureliella helgolandensis]QDV26902.1 hypothetical protein Q31a_52820 [Aureliella helgolandensis]